jgi:Leucine-rich repeat (LRR) protein
VLSELTKLEFVDLADNHISSIPDLAKLKKLAWLILFNNKFDDIPAVRKQIGLERAVVVMYEGNRDPNITPPPLETAIVRPDNDYVFNEPMTMYSTSHTKPRTANA